MRHLIAGFIKDLAELQRNSLEARRYPIELGGRQCGKQVIFECPIFGHKKLLRTIRVESMDRENISQGRLHEKDSYQCDGAHTKLCTRRILHLSLTIYDDQGQRFIPRSKRTLGFRRRSQHWRKSYEQWGATDSRSYFEGWCIRRRKAAILHIFIAIRSHPAESKLQGNFMKNIKGRAIRVIKRLSIEPVEKARTQVKPVIDVEDSGSSARVVGNWIMESRENRVAEVVFSDSKILAWKSS
jgi:hypothetical protein